MKIRGRYFARKDILSKIRGDLKHISKNFAELLPENASVEICDTELGDFIMVNGEVVIFKSDTGYFPTVRGALKIDVDKKFVTVDKGAVAYITNGADVMVPGVVAFDEGICREEPVIVNEEVHGKPLAVGVALMNGADFKKRKSGKCVRTVYYVGDKVWGLGRS